MGKSQETFSKKEKEKKRLKKRQEKLEKMQERKANAKKGKTLDEMMAYIDEYGNLSSTPPIPGKKKPVQINGNGRVEAEVRNGMVSFFDADKGFGFIIDEKSKQRVFVHINQLSVSIKANDKVTFELEMGPKGASAKNISLS